MMNLLARLTAVALVTVVVAGCAGNVQPDTADAVWNEFSDIGKRSACSSWSSGDTELLLRFLTEIRYSDPDDLPAMSQDEYGVVVLEAVARYC